MDYDELREAVFSIVNDPCRVSKQLQLEDWCVAFLDLFSIRGKEELPFFLGVLSDEECWEKTDTMHGIKLNRRIAAKKMVELQSWRGKSNPLDDFYRYQLACWCCLEEDIITLFEHFKHDDKIKDDDIVPLRKLVKSVSGSYYTDAMMEYWSHVVSGYASELELEGRHPYVYGLDRALGMRRVRVEAVEFFWNRIKSLPEDELSAQQKDEIFMKAAVRAAGSHCKNYPEIFKFCFSQISPDRYSELLKKDFAENSYYGSVNILQNALCFDQFQRLFDCLKPCDISEDQYHVWLKYIGRKDCSGHLADAGIRLFMHMWVKEGFDGHRALVLRKEITVRSCFLATGLLIPFIHRNYMEPVWAVLDKASPDQIKEFMSSKQADYIRSVLKERGDKDSLDKFLSYSKSVVGKFDGSNIDLTEVKLSRAYNLGLGNP